MKPIKRLTFPLAILISLVTACDYDRTKDPNTMSFNKYDVDVTVTRIDGNGPNLFIKRDSVRERVTILQDEFRTTFYSLVGIEPGRVGYQRNLFFSFRDRNFQAGRIYRTSDEIRVFSKT
jgi:hypothetical protein